MAPRVMEVSPARKSLYTLADVRPHQGQHVGIVPAMSLGTSARAPVLPLVPAVKAKAAPKYAAQLFRCGGAMYRTRICGRECWMPSPAIRWHFSGPLAISRGLAFLAECKRDQALRRIVEGFGVDLEDWAEQIEIAQLPENKEIWA